MEPSGGTGNGRLRRWAGAAAALSAAVIVVVVVLLTENGRSGVTPQVLTTAPTTRLAVFPQTRPGADLFRPERERMVRQLVERYDSPQVTDARVLAAMKAVPRHRFVPGDQGELAYADSPLPIGHGQTISQPYIVGLMSQLLETKPGDKVLEVGTGSGYQAAILADMGCTVYTIEIVRPLGESAARRLKDLNYTNVAVQVGDGYFGWKEHAPYDAIIVTAAASHVPPPLIQQLKPGGKMCIPVGQAFGVQDLMVLTRQAEGGVRSRSIIPVSFVPLTGGRKEP